MQKSIKNNESQGKPMTVNEFLRKLTQILILSGTHPLNCVEVGRQRSQSGPVCDLLVTRLTTSNMRSAPPQPPAAHSKKVTVV